MAAVHQDVLVDGGSPATLLLLWTMGELAGGGSVAVAFGVSDR